VVRFARCEREPLTLSSLFVTPERTCCGPAKKRYLGGLIWRNSRLTQPKLERAPLTAIAILGVEPVSDNTSTRIDKFVERVREHWNAPAVAMTLVRVTKGSLN
jgi:hypothetical protein